MLTPPTPIAIGAPLPKIWGNLTCLYIRSVVSCSHTLETTLASCKRRKISVGFTTATLMRAVHWTGVSQLDWLVVERVDRCDRTSLVNATAFTLRHSSARYADYSEFICHAPHLVETGAAPNILDWLHVIVPYTFTPKVAYVSAHFHRFHRWFSVCCFCIILQ